MYTVKISQRTRRTKKGISHFGGSLKLSGLIDFGNLAMGTDGVSLARRKKCGRIRKDNICGTHDFDYNLCLTLQVPRNDFVRTLPLGSGTVPDDLLYGIVVRRSLRRCWLGMLRRRTSCSVRRSSHWIRRVPSELFTGMLLLVRNRVFLR